MRRIKNWKLWENIVDSQKERFNFLESFVNGGKWYTNEEGNVDIIDGDLKYGPSGDRSLIPVKFGKIISQYTDRGNFEWGNNLKELTNGPIMVSGNYNVSSNLLTNLKGAPRIVGGDFNITGNPISSLVGSPESIGSSFYAGGNSLENLEGISPNIGGGIYLHENKLTSLKGLPKIVNGSLILSNNLLKSLNDCPEIIIGRFKIDGNPLYSLRGMPSKVGVLEAYNSNMSEETFKLVYDGRSRGYSYDESILVNLPKFNDTDVAFLMQDFKVNGIGLKVKEENLMGSLSRLKGLSLKMYKAILKRLELNNEAGDTATSLGELGY